MPAWLCRVCHIAAQGGAGVQTPESVSRAGYPPSLGLAVPLQVLLASASPSRSRPDEPAASVCRR